VLPATVIDAAPLGADMHMFVNLGSGRRLAVLETNRGQALRQPGHMVTLRFTAEDCIVVPGEA
jgi:TOBE domain